jgi:Glycosyl hydrolases family 15
MPARVLSRCDLLLAARLHRPHDDTHRVRARCPGGPTGRIRTVPTLTQAPRWRALIDHVETIWQEPDDGIWEARGPRRHYTQSKVMAWVVFDAAIKLAEHLDPRSPVDAWKRVRQQIPTRCATRATTPSATPSPSTTPPRSWTRGDCDRRRRHTDPGSGHHRPPRTTVDLAAPKPASRHGHAEAENRRHLLRSEQHEAAVSPCVAHPAALLPRG